MAYDAYLVSCKVYIDEVVNGAATGSQIHDITDRFGAYSISINSLAEPYLGQNLKLQPAAQLSGASSQVEEGSSICHDAITRLRFLVPLQAPRTAKVVSPLTTLVSHAVALPASISEAQKIVKFALNIDDKTDLLTYDTIAGLYRNEADAFSIIRRTAQVLNIVTQGLALLESSSAQEEILKSMTKEMKTYYDSSSDGQARRRRNLMQSSGFNLTSATFVSKLYKEAATSVGSSSVSDSVIDTVATSLADLNSVLSQVSGTTGVDLLQEVARVDIVLQTDVKSQVSKIANETTDAQNFLDATSTTVVKNKASNTVLLVDVAKYLAAAVENEEDNKGLSMMIIIVGGSCLAFLIGALVIVFYMQRKGKQGQAIYNQQLYYGGSGGGMGDESPETVTRYNPTFGKEGGNDDDDVGRFSLLDQFGTSVMMQYEGDD